MNAPARTAAALAALLAAAGVHAQEAPPPWRENDDVPDLTTWLARRAPPSLQAAALVGLDLLLPVAVAAPGALAALVAGSAVLALPASGTSTTLTVERPLQAPLAGAAAAIGAGAVGMMAADLAFNTLHLQRVAPARFVGMVVVGAGAAALLGAPLAAMALLSSVTPRPPAAVQAGAAAAFTGGALLFAWVPLGALGLSTMVRMWSDYEDGSALWTRAGAATR